MTLIEIKDFIRNWIQDELGIIAIEARQGAPRPPLPYATYLFINPSLKVNGQDEIVPNEDDTWTQMGMRSSLVSLNILGQDANNLMSDLRDSLDRPDIIDLFVANEISQYSLTGPNDLTELEDTKYVERSQMDVNIYYAINKETGVVPIESVEVTGFDSTMIINIEE